MRLGSACQAFAPAWKTLFRESNVCGQHTIYWSAQYATRSGLQTRRRLRVGEAQTPPNLSVDNSVSTREIRRKAHLDIAQMAGQLVRTIARPLTKLVYALN
jgi:hypothetical protein